MLWDRLFGTYAEEQEEVVYGLVNNVKTNNPITLTFYVWREIIADMSASSSVRELWLSLFGPPEWQPTSEKTKS